MSEIKKHVKIKFYSFNFFCPVRYIEVFQVRIFMLDLKKCPLYRVARYKLFALKRFWDYSVTLIQSVPRKSARYWVVSRFQCVLYEHLRFSSKKPYPLLLCVVLHTMKEKQYLHIYLNQVLILGFQFYFIDFNYYRMALLKSAVVV